ncbi:MAG: hypothetical protein JJE50_14980 [Actinomycetales bacterium]|nr:hypothetical protein [Actinomycetales bacterium]
MDLEQGPAQLFAEVRRLRSAMVFSLARHPSHRSACVDAHSPPAELGEGVDRHHVGPFHLVRRDVVPRPTHRGAGREPAGVDLHAPRHRPHDQQRGRRHDQQHPPVADERAEDDAGGEQDGDTRPGEPAR